MLGSRDARSGDHDDSSPVISVQNIQMSQVGDFGHDPLREVSKVHGGKLERQSSASPG
jgi:hypothetical protein